MDIKTSHTLHDFRDHDLFIDPPYIPAGWELTWAHAETVIWDDGSRRDSKFALVYYRPEYTEIRIMRFLIAPEGQVELLAPPAGATEALTLGEIRGVPVVYEQDPLRVHFVVGDVVTQIESPLMRLEELIKIADALIGREPQEPQKTLCKRAQEVDNASLSGSRISE